jgi:hypothetical protein
LTADATTRLARAFRRAATAYSALAAAARREDGGAYAAAARAARRAEADVQRALAAVRAAARG